MASFERFTGTDSYIASEELSQAVNVALALERPLLLRGEPGTGKTLLAESLASALRLPLIRWHVKSTTKARDGLYVYDTVARLHDSRFGDGDVKDVKSYIKLGPLGQALSEDRRVVLLIDEIDKADIEFPNDLLLELDAMRFRIDETGDEVAAQERPFVIITSNNEKELPDAFLRRCIFHYIDFPTKELMKRIVRVHHPDVEDRVLDQAIEMFFDVRDNPRLRKKPSTSELIDWICALRAAGVDLSSVGGGIPFLGTLLKTEQDIERFGEGAPRSRMFVDFLFDLRKHGVLVTAHEWNTLMEALSLGLHDSSLTGFYQLARSICVKDETEFDAFDAAFLHTFRGVEQQAFDLSEQIREWLKDPLRRPLSDEERALLQSLDIDKLREMFEQRLREQKKRHQGGNRWIGTGGTSPFGSHGTHPSGLRIGQGGGRSAMQVAGERRYREYRKDRVLDVRQIDVALRRLRQLGRDGAPEELDLDDTVEATCKNAGDLELRFAPPKRNRLKLTLLMDVGGSMDPYAELVERLFSAASRSGRFSRFRYFYFHNCIYDAVYRDARFRDKLILPELFDSSDRSERLVIVGDALMHPGELMQMGGSIYYSDYNRTPGIEWLRRLREHFPRSAWLNPEPEQYWRNTTIELIADIFPMWMLSMDGLNDAIRYLVRSGSPNKVAA